MPQGAYAFLNADEPLRKKVLRKLMAWQALRRRDPETLLHKGPLAAGLWRCRRSIPSFRPLRKRDNQRALVERSTHKRHGLSG